MRLDRPTRVTRRPPRSRTQQPARCFKGPRECGGEWGSRGSEEHDLFSLRGRDLFSAALWPYDPFFRFFDHTLSQSQMASLERQAEDKLACQSVDGRRFLPDGVATGDEKTILTQ